MAAPVFSLDSFCHRQFDDEAYSGTKINISKTDFLARCNALHEQAKEANGGACPLAPGYAPFCKHLFVENFVGGTALSNCVEVSLNHHADFSHVCSHATTVFFCRNCCLFFLCSASFYSVSCHHRCIRLDRSQSLTDYCLDSRYAS